MVEPKRRDGSLKPRHTSGFSLVEALLAVVLLALMSGILSALFISGMQNLDARQVRLRIDSALRSQMERLLSANFAELSSGSSVVAIEGINYTVDWSVDLVDLDGDSVPEPTAKQITVSLNDSSLTTIYVDHEGALGKL